MSSLETSFKSAETSLAQALEAKRAAIDDATGKGAATEALFKSGFSAQTCHLISVGERVPSFQQLIHPQSPVIDRVVYDVSAASPILYDEAHSIFPVEAVCGLVEITMRLDTAKLREAVL